MNGFRIDFMTSTTRCCFGLLASLRRDRLEIKQSHRKFLKVIRKKKVDRSTRMGTMVFTTRLEFPSLFYIFFWPSVMFVMLLQHHKKKKNIHKEQKKYSQLSATLKNIYENVVWCTLKRTRANLSVTPHQEYPFLCLCLKLEIHKFYNKPENICFNYREQ